MAKRINLSVNERLGKMIENEAAEKSLFESEVVRIALENYFQSGTINEKGRFMRHTLASPNYLRVENIEKPEENGEKITIDKKLFLNLLGM